MSELLFIRHAETDMAGTFCGHSDPELNARGRAQVGELIDRLRTEEIGVVYTSDLRRAHATGMAIAEAFAVDCHVRSALREINFGQWEGPRGKRLNDEMMPMLVVGLRSIPVCRRRMAKVSMNLSGGCWMK